MKYALPAIAADEEEMDYVQSKVVGVMLQRLGFSSKLPKAIRHGPSELGGLGIIDLRTEIGITQIKLIRDAILTGKETGKLFILSLQYTQREAGLSQPLLEFPGIYIPYVTPTWITSLRQYLYNHNLTITITDTHTISTTGKWDQCIMNPAYLTGYSATQQRQINRVRLHLQVATLSDMTDATGLSIRAEYLSGSRPSDFVSSIAWPRQPSVSKSQKRLWTRYVASHFLRYDRKWKQCITPHSADKSQQRTTPSPPQPTQHSTLKSYLASLPLWYQRLLHTYRQCASDLVIWRHFRSKKKVVIVSDGGLALGIGTFGWKIVSSTNDTLFAGAGPIDGPRDMGSSTRSDSGGPRRTTPISRQPSPFLGPQAQVQVSLDHR